MTAELPELWERQKSEPEAAYGAFKLYLNGPTPRKLQMVISELAVSRTIISRWCNRWAWRDRARAWDTYLEEQARRDQIKEAKAMGRRQARDAAAFQMVLIAPVETLLKRIHATGGDELERLSTPDLIALSVVASRAFPRVARAERDARGAPIPDLSAFLDADTGELAEPQSPREVYDWTREALAALEQATKGRRALPPGGTDA